MPLPRKNIRLPPDRYIGKNVYFITICCSDRRPTLRDADVVSAILATLRDLSARREFAIHAYCFMPDHLHLLCEGLTNHSRLVDFLSRFKQQTTFDRTQSGLRSAALQGGIPALAATVEAKECRAEARRYVIPQGHKWGAPDLRSAALQGGSFLHYPLDTGSALCGTHCTMTKRMTSGARVRSPLTDLENEVMRAVWDAEPCTVEAVHQVVSRKRDLKETTTRTLLRRLEQKGDPKHESDGRAYVYRAVEPARSLAARAVRQIIDRFCQGSVEELVTGMVDAKVLSKADMEELEKVVRKGRRVRAVLVARSEKGGQ